MSTTGSAGSPAAAANRPAAKGEHDLPPFPEGWYFVASREGILRRRLIEKTWLG